MLRVMDAPGFYAAFPWGGYAQSKGATGTRSNAIGARALYSPLSLPVSSYTRFVYSATVAISTEQYTEGLHWSSPARGAVLYTDKFPLMAEPGLRTREILAMHRTQRAPFDEKHAHQRRP